MECKAVIEVVCDEKLTPYRGTEYAGGYDLKSNNDYVIYPGKRKLIDTGVKMSIPDGYVGIIKSRSGLARDWGIDTMAGVIDSDYRGTINVLLHNTNNVSFRIKRLDRIAQIVIVPYLAINFVNVEKLDETKRGEGGFGHTGT